MQAKHIGIVACSPESAALCYICLEALFLMGEHNHPRITLDAIPRAQHMIPINRDDWKEVADLMLDSAEKVAVLGCTEIPLIVMPEDAP
jgi:aspartate racemase